MNQPFAEEFLPLNPYRGKEEVALSAIRAHKRAILIEIKVDTAGVGLMLGKDSHRLPSVP